jgi:ornithine cyclodeaminase
MREADDEAVRRARVFVDTREGALAEAGDLVQPIRSGVLREPEVAGELAELARGLVPGRKAPEEITLFKSVGTALEDLAAARYALERAG